jgi:hypothetical protein
MEDNPSYVNKYLRFRGVLASGFVWCRLGLIADYESGGREFESLRARQLKINDLWKNLAGRGRRKTLPVSVR